MNEEARAELDRIVAMEPEALTDGEQAFLMARRSYLTEEQRIKFGITEDSEVTEDAPKTRKSKKDELGE